MVIYVRLARLKCVVEIEHAIPRCQIQNGPVQSFSPTSHTVDIDDPVGKPGRWGESNCIDPTGNPVAWPFDRLSKCGDRAAVAHNNMVKLSQSRQPVFESRNVDGIDFVNPTYACS